MADEINTVNDSSSFKSKGFNDQTGDKNNKVFDLHEGGASLEAGAHDLVSEVGQQLSRFLDETQGSVDEFMKGVRKSADEVLTLAEDNRVQSFMIVLLAGAAVGAFAAGAIAKTAKRAA